MIAILGRKDLGTGILRNLTDGGEGVSGWNPSKETRKKLSESNKLRKHSEESKRKMSKSQKGKTILGKDERKLGKINKSKFFSEETRRRMSDTHKNRYSKESEEHKKLRALKIKAGHNNQNIEKKKEISLKALNSNKQKIEIIVEGIKFKSINSAARWAQNKYDIGINTAIRYIKVGRIVNNRYNNQNKKVK